MIILVIILYLHCVESLSGIERSRALRRRCLDDGETAKKDFGRQLLALGIKVCSSDKAEPTYIVDGIVHYCVANMPGAVPRTSTLALNQRYPSF